MTPHSIRRSLLVSAVAAAALLLDFASLAAASAVEEVPLSADDECASADGEDPSCGLSALQLRAKQQQEHEQHEQKDTLEHVLEADLEEGENSTQQGCTGMPGCNLIMKFNKLFDTNKPDLMQEAMNQFTEWKSSDQGIKVAVTKDHYYEMYHGNVGSKLGQYLPQGLFDWHYGKKYELVKKTANTAVIARTGTITFNLGWWRRSMFWNACVKGLPSGKFDFSNVDKFDDCKNCASKMEYILKKGGLSGTENGWRIVDLLIIKLK